MNIPKDLEFTDRTLDLPSSLKYGQDHAELEQLCNQIQELLTVAQGGNPPHKPIVRYTQIRSAEDPDPKNPPTQIRTRIYRIRP